MSQGAGRGRGAGGRRLVNTVLEKPIVHGNIAWWMGNAQPQGSQGGDPEAEAAAQRQPTHKWCCYVRPADLPGPASMGGGGGGGGSQGAQPGAPVYEGELTNWIKKVVFTLHPTFPDNVRVVEEPPFQVWLGFEIVITIHFVDNLEKPVDLYHPLQLFSPEQHSASHKPLIAEFYEELIFVNPKEELANRLKIPGKRPPKSLLPEISAQQCGSFTDEQCYNKLTEAHQKVKEQVQALQARLLQLNTDITAAGGSTGTTGENGHDGDVVIVDNP
ncbi:YEATS family protein [Pelomyxa schiedti]|nr:YEATS family protein [Pelomyxa schiedti]